MIQLVPSGISLQILEEDYSAMLADGLLRMNFPKFTNLIDRCSEIQDQINHAFSWFNKDSCTPLDEWCKQSF